MRDWDKKTFDKIFKEVNPCKKGVLIEATSKNDVNSSYNIYIRTFNPLPVVALSYDGSYKIDCYIKDFFITSRVGCKDTFTWNIPIGMLAFRSDSLQEALNMLRIKVNSLQKLTNTRYQFTIH